MRDIYVVIIVFVVAVASGMGGFIAGGAIGGGFSGLAVGAGYVEGINDGSLKTADYIANNSDAKYVSQGDGDVILYIPNASTSDANTSAEIGYTPVLYYNNSSGTWDNYPIREYARDNVTDMFWNQSTSSLSNKTETATPLPSA